MSMFPPAAQPAGGPGQDLLVPPPDGGLDPWWDRLKELLQRSAKPLGIIVLLTFAVPQVLANWAGEVLADGAFTPGGGLVVPMEDATDPGAVAFPSVGVFAWLMVVYLAVMFVGAIGWGAGIWAVTAAAAGERVEVGAALGAGVRRMLPMFGWYLLYSLMIMVGIILCVLPGLYLGVAGALFSFVVIYERGRNPIGRSFTLVHSAFGMALGRIALLLAFVLVVFCAVGLCVGLIGLGGGIGARLVGDVIMSLLMVVVYPVVLVGLLLTYTQVRARQEPVTTGGLWAAANEDALGPPPGYAGPVQPG